MGGRIQSEWVAGLRRNYRPVGIGILKQGDFPKSIPLGGNSKGWLLSDIEAWLNERREGAL